MVVTVRTFAGIREELGFDRKSIYLPKPITVEGVWEVISESDIPVNLLCAVNQEYALLDKMVADGDEIAFFPPVNGAEVQIEIRQQRFDPWQELARYQKRERPVAGKLRRLCCFRRHNAGFQSGRKCQGDGSRTLFRHDGKNC